MTKEEICQRETEILCRESPNGEQTLICLNQKQTHLSLWIKEMDDNYTQMGVCPIDSIDEVKTEAQEWWKKCFNDTGLLE